MVVEVPSYKNDEQTKAKPTTTGRHLAMMPHPERCFLDWQWPFMPEGGIPAPGGGAHTGYTPWLKMFQNAREWCEATAGN